MKFYMVGVYAVVGLIVGAIFVIAIHFYNQLRDMEAMNQRLNFEIVTLRQQLEAEILARRIESKGWITMKPAP